MNNKPSLTLRIVRGAIIAAVYFALSYLLMPVKVGGAIELRVAEALVVLALFFPEAIWGLTVGCFIANFFTGLGALDVIFGTLATLLASFLTYKLRKNIYIALMPPVVVNALVVGTVIALASNTQQGWLALVLLMAISQAITCYALGIPLYKGIRKVFKLEDPSYY